MIRPRVSVMVPVYNRENYLAPCLESALAQTFSDFELIVVDNASTDGTWSICQSFAVRDNRVRIFRNESNIGPVRNWNRCFNEATGTLGKLLFSDDLISPTFLEKTVPWLDDPRVGFVFTGCDLVDSEARARRVGYQWLSSSGTTSSNTFIAAALETGRIPVSPGAALFRAADLRRNLKFDIPSPTFHNFSNHGAGPDLLLYLLTAASYPRVYYVHEQLASFRAHPQSITISTAAGEIQDYYHQARIWFARETENEEWFRSALVRAWLGEVIRSRKAARPSKILRKFVASPEVGIDAVRFATESARQIWNKALERK